MECLGKWGRGKGTCCEVNETPHAVQPRVQRKAKAPQRPQPAGWPPTEETFTKRECTSTELIDTAAKFQQKARASIPAWLVHLRDTGEMAFLWAGSRENEQLHHTPCSPAAPAWRSKVQSTHSLIDWLILACREVWPNEGHLPGHVEP